MKYVSTRGLDCGSFEDAVLAGWASDGGMILPEIIPRLDIDSLLSNKNLCYQDILYEVLKLYTVNSIVENDLKDIIKESFDESFDVPTIIKNKSINYNNIEMDIAELWHGPTLAFKDLGMQVLARILNYFLKKRNERRIIIVGTSGDTGSAAVESLAGLDKLDLIVLYPGNNRISATQELQMTSCKSSVDDKIKKKYSNIRIIAVDGTSDDLDYAVEGNLKDKCIAKKYKLGSVNSVNIVRVLVQAANFVYLCYKNNFDRVNFMIPTGAAGNIASASLAKAMGMNLIAYAATNSNNAIQDFLDKGKFLPDINNGVRRTLASAMDIAVPYNIERLLSLLNRKLELPLMPIEQFMSTLRKEGNVHLDENLYGSNSIFEPLGIRSGAMATDDDILMVMKEVNKTDQYILDPHTACGVHAVYICHSSGTMSAEDKRCKWLVIGCAHISKFPDVATKAFDVSLHDLLTEKFDTTTNVDTLLELSKGKDIDIKEWKVASGVDYFKSSEVDGTPLIKEWTTNLRRIIEEIYASKNIN